jgi:hypothetical protein
MLHMAMLTSHLAVDPMHQARHAPPAVSVFEPHFPVTTARHGRFYPVGVSAQVDNQANSRHW